MLTIKSNLLILLVILTITTNGQTVNHNVINDIKILVTDKLQNLNNSQQQNISEEICLNHFLEILHGLEKFHTWAIKSNFNNKIKKKTVKF